MHSSFDAIVIGAGPAGSTAAILLARAGWHVALVEKQRFPRRKVCGECLAASNLILLEALGIGAHFDENAGPQLTTVALMQGARSVQADLPHAEFPSHAFGRALGRETLDTLLLNQACESGVEVFQPWAVESISGTRGDHQCVLRAIDTGKRLTLSTPVMIAANGSWEPLPSERAARRLHRRPSDLLAFKANFRGSNLAAGLLPVLSFAGGYGGMVVAGDGVTTLACCIRADRLERLRRETPGVRVGNVIEQALTRECRGVAIALKDAERDGEWLASGPLAPGVRLSRNDPYFKIGNAAAEVHPIIGEGMSIAMQSAWLLCSQLVSANTFRGVTASPEWHRVVGKKYRADWHRHFAARLRLAACFAHLAMRPTASAPLFAMLGLVPHLLTRGAILSGKVRCAVSLETIALLASGLLQKQR